MSSILSTPKTAVIFNKRNTLTEVDPHTAVNGIWTVVMEDSTVNIKGCIINNNTNGCIIASNSNATVTNSTLSGQQAGRTTPIVGIKNSKIYWDKPAQLGNTYPYLITTQDSFANFPYYATTVGPQALPSGTGALYAVLNSGSEIHLQDLKGHPRLLNDGSTFYWDEKDLIYPYDIDSYKLNVLTSTTLTELNHLPKNLHRRDLKIIINAGVTINSTSINGFYNGKVIIEFKSDCKVTSLKISNLDHLEIYNGSISTSGTSGSVIEIENVKYVNIHDLTFNINKTDVNFYGAKFHVPACKTYEHDFSTNILIDQDMIMYKKLETWLKMISRYEISGGGIKVIPTCKLRVKLLDSEHQYFTTSVVMDGAYITSLAATTFDYNGGPDVTPITVAATFKIQYYYRDDDLDLTMDPLSQARVLAAYS